MATYPVKNRVTGEQKQVSMSIHEWDQWKTDNPDWDRDWSAGAASAVSGVGDYQDKLPQGFKDRLRNVKKHHPYARFEAP